jgi:transcriptional regulator with XRE-family HTH domain
MAQETDILESLYRRRRDLGMPYDELARRCGVSISTLKRVLGGEATASFATVSAIADALGVRLGSEHAEDVASMRQRQARAKARTLVALVQGTSALEGQAVASTDIELMEQRTAAELLSGPARRLWAR